MSYYLVCTFKMTVQCIRFLNPVHSPSSLLSLNRQPLPSVEELHAAVRVQRWLARERDCAPELDAARATLIRALRLAIFSLAVSDFLLLVLDAEQLERASATDTQHFLFLLRYGLRL